MMPSTGIFSPGLIIKISSRLISSILIVFSSPFFKMHAVVGDKSIRDFIAFLVLSLEYD